MTRSIVMPSAPCRRRTRRTRFRRALPRGRLRRAWPNGSAAESKRSGAQPAHAGCAAWSRRAAESALRAALAVALQNIDTLARQGRPRPAQGGGGGFRRDRRRFRPRRDRDRAAGLDHNPFALDRRNRARGRRGSRAAGTRRSPASKSSRSAANPAKRRSRAAISPCGPRSPSRSAKARAFSPGVVSPRDGAPVLVR